MYTLIIHSEIDQLSIQHPLYSYAILCNKIVHESSYEMPEIPIRWWFNPYESSMILGFTKAGPVRHGGCHHGGSVQPRLAVKDVHWILFTMKTCEKKRYKTTSMGILNYYMYIQLYIYILYNGMYNTKHIMSTVCSKMSYGPRLYVSSQGIGGLTSGFGEYHMFA